MRMPTPSEAANGTRNCAWMARSRMSGVKPSAGYRVLDRREPPSRIPFVETVSVSAGSGAIPVRGAGIVRPSAEIDLAPQVRCGSLEAVTNRYGQYSIRAG